MKKALAVLLTFLLCSFAAVISGNWQPAADAKVNFVIDGMFGKDVHGTISELRSSIIFHEDDLSNSTISASINPATIDTRNKKRDRHLKTSDFFEIEKYPTIRFVSRSFRKVGEYYVVEGDLTLKDVTRPVTIPFEFMLKGDSAVFNGDFAINRLEYHLGKKSRLMGNEVRIHLNIPVHSKN